jgi:hypothetical protein
LADVTLRPGGNFGFPDECKLEDGTIPYLKRTECEKMPNVLRDWIEFLVDIERKYWVGMYRYLKDDLKVKQPISGTQLNYGSTHVQAELDYCDNHAYWNHPSWPVKSWDAFDWYVRNRALVNSADKEIFGPLATARVAGKPYTISEYNHPYPNQYSGEGLPMLAAFGRFQRWNGIFQYTYAHKVDTEPDKLTGYFDMNVHALQLVHSPACSAMFMRGFVDAVPRDFQYAIWLDNEIEILAKNLTPHALNFSGIDYYEGGIPVDMALNHATALIPGSRPIISIPMKMRISRPAPNGLYLANCESKNWEGQLRWDMTQKDAGYFTVNTLGIKVFTGFVRDREFVFTSIDTIAQLPQRGRTSAPIGAQDLAQGNALGNNAATSTAALQGQENDAMVNPAREHLPFGGRILGTIFSEFRNITCLISRTYVHA